MQAGPYEIVGELGRGGMGAVYRARHRDLGRDVAIKVMLERSPDAEVTERFIREVQLAAKTSGHPGIVRVHHAGCLPDGRLYYVMELVAGRSLQTIVKEGPLDPERAARYVAQLAEAVHHAHGQGVVHRDIAPKNVIVDPEDRPRILDFGLAKPISDVTRLTASGTILGTPAYMAPEQAEGSGAVGPAADIYALGATLYACLAGRPPFEGPMHQIVYRVLEDEPPPLGDGVPADLRAIVRRAMAKDPADRPESALEVAADLRTHLRGERLAPRARHGPRPLALAGGALLLALAPILLVIVLRGGEGPPPAGSEPPPPPPPPSTEPAAPAEGELPAEALDAVRLFRDEGAVGLSVALAFRALYPDRTADAGSGRDPLNPFHRWEASETAALRETLARAREAGGYLVSGRRSVPASLSATLDRLHEGREDPAVWAVWAAGTAAVGQDGRVLRDRRPGNAGCCLVAARLHLVRGESDRAVEVLAGVPEGDPRAVEAHLLRALAYLLQPDLESVRREIATIGGPPSVRAEADLLRAVVELASAPSLSPEDALREGARHRAIAALRAGRAEDPRCEPLLLLEARVLAAMGSYAEALALLEGSLERGVPSVALRDTYVAVLDATLRASSEDGLRARSLRSGQIEAARAALQWGGRSRETLLAACERLGGAEAALPSVLAALARWSDDLDAEGRERLRSLARGIDAQGFGLAGRALDRALRLLATRGAEATYDALLLSSVARTLTNASHALLLPAALRVSGVGTAASPWGLVAGDPDEAYDALEWATLGSGLDAPLLLAYAEMRLQRAEADAGGTASEDFPPARRAIDLALAGLDPGSSPEAHLLRARCAAGEGDAATAVEAAGAALAAYRPGPLLSRDAWGFYEDLVRVLSRVDAPGATALRQAAEAAAAGLVTDDGLDAAGHAFDESTGADDRDRVAIADRVFPRAPFRGHASSVDDAYAEEGRAWEGMVLRARDIVLRDWDTVTGILKDVGTRPFRGYREGLLRHRSGETVDGALAAALVHLAIPGAHAEDLIRASGLATSLLAVGVAPGPLLTLRGYARLRLDDPRGARGDLEAAGRAVDFGAEDAASVVQSRRLPGVFLAVAGARLEDRADVDEAVRRLRDVGRTGEDPGEPLRWVTRELASYEGTFAEDGVLSTFATHPLLHELQQLLPEGLRDP